MRSTAEALAWYRKAAEQGDVEAQARLGVCFDEGIGVMKDPIEAYKWFNLSAAQGNKKTAQWRDSLARSMTRDQVAEAQHCSTEFLARRPLTLASGL